MTDWAGGVDRKEVGKGRRREGEILGRARKEKGRRKRGGRQGKEKGGGAGKEDGGTGKEEV